MADDEQELQKLLTDPREGLDFELKQWIDPTKPEGIAKIAKACIALRNNNGGRLAIGFKDDGRPDLIENPIDVRAKFHGDVIQSIVSRYSSEQFSVEVVFVGLSGRSYPVIIVPSGVRTPVAAKATLTSCGGKPLIRDHSVYVRSLNSNNTVSSTEARRGDWETLTRICFDNREADIGGFVRRHLATFNLEALATFIPAFTEMRKHPTTMERVAAELNRDRLRFDNCVKERKVQIPSLGYRESVIIVDGEFLKQSSTESFRQNILSKAPRHTGWSPWIDRSDAQDDQHKPYVLENGWEALIDHLNPQSFSWPGLDYWRIEPEGVFYHLRALEDDLAGERGPNPRTELDFLLQISRVAEVISTGLSFGRSLGCDEVKTSLTFGFRWTGLAGRRLTTWVEPTRMLGSSGESKQDRITTFASLPLETPPAGVAPHVENAVRDVFALFGGKEIDSRVIEKIVSQVIERRM